MLWAVTCVLEENYASSQIETRIEQYPKKYSFERNQKL